MKIIKSVTKVELEEKELACLEEAESILAEICNSFETKDECLNCPMYGICRRLESGILPQSILQYALGHLDCIEER